MTLTAVTPLRASALQTPRTHAQQQQRQHELRLALPRARFLLTWVAITVGCGLNTVIALVFVAIYYGGLTIRGGYLLEASGLLSPAYIPFVIASYAVVAVYFGSHLVAILWSSLRQRRFAFPTTSTSHRPHDGKLRPLRLVSTAWHRLTHPFRFDALCCRSLSSAEAFDLQFLLRELLEIGLQTFQAYKCSLLVSQHYINTFYVAVLTANCWAAPLILLCTRHAPALRRFRQLWSDLALDFASTFVVPVWTVYSMVLTAVLDNMTRESVAENAFDVPYDDVFLMNLFKAVQQIGVTSVLDVISKLLPFLSMASCVGHIERLVVERDHTDTLVPDKEESASVSEATRPHEPSGEGASALPRRTQRSPRSLGRLFFSTHGLLAAWGVVVLALHLHANTVSHREPIANRRGCKSSSRPWLVDQFSCTVLEINCYRRGIAGSADEIDDALAHLSPHGVSSLILAHCPRLSVPPKLQRLSNLIGFEIANSTLVEWGTNAALLDENHRSLQFLSIVRVNLTALPMALQSPRFPPSLTNINIAGTNLTSLPDDLHTKWRRLLNLYLERSRFTSVPVSAMKMQLDRFSMMHNQITELPSEALATNRFQAFSVAHNPITVWPTTLGAVDELTMVIMDHTELVELPPWLLAEGQRRAATKAASIVVSAGGSAYCNKLSSKDDASTATLAGLKLSCRLKADAEIEAYPFAFSASNRAP